MMRLISIYSLLIVMGEKMVSLFWHVRKYSPWLQIHLQKEILGFSITYDKEKKFEILGAIDAAFLSLIGSVFCVKLVRKNCPFRWW